MNYLLTETAGHLKIPSIHVDQKIFPDGELHLQIKENIKGKVLTVISNIGPDNILELLFSIDAAKRAGAIIKRLIIPYLGYARQDRGMEYGEAVAGEVICSFLKELHIPITVFDLHSERLKQSFSCEEVSALPLLAKQLPQKKWTIISPDKGGELRARKIAKLLQSPIALMSKRRISADDVTITFSDDVQDKPVLLVDDMISTGSTIAEAAKVLRRSGAKEIYCIATHGIFADDAVQKLQRSGIRKIIVSNTLTVKPSKQIEVIDVEKMILKI